MEEYPNFVRTREYTDPSGVLWSRCGTGVLAGKDLARRLRQPENLVMHSYLGEVRVIPRGDRDRFLRTAEETMTRSEYSDFVGVDFRNSSGQHLIVVEERC